MTRAFKILLTLFFIAQTTAANPTPQYQQKLSQALNKLASQLKSEDSKSKKLKVLERWVRGDFKKLKAPPLSNTHNSLLHGEFEIVLDDLILRVKQPQLPYPGSITPDAEPKNTRFDCARFFIFWRAMLFPTENIDENFSLRSLKPIIDEFCEF